MGKKSIFYFFMPILLSLIHCISHIQASSKTITIERKSVYPNKFDDYYFKPLVDMEIHNNKLYAVENFGHRLIIFDLNGEIQLDKVVSQSGQGPGDLNLPISLSVDQDEIAVKDSYGFSFFDVEGNFINKFRAYTQKSNFIFRRNNIYWVNFSPDDNHLIEIYSKQGERLSTFGNKYLKLNFDLFDSNRLGPYFIEDNVYSGNLMTDGEYIYFINSFFGRVDIFNYSGERIKNSYITDLFGDLGTKTIGENTKLWLTDGFTIKRDGIVYTYMLFLDAYLTGNTIYLLKNYWPPKADSGDDKVSILAIDKSTFILIKEYSFPRDKDDSISTCFAVLERDNIPTFFIFIRTLDGDIIAEYSEKT